MGEIIRNILPLISKYDYGKPHNEIKTEVEKRFWSVTLFQYLWKMLPLRPFQLNLRNCYVSHPSNSDLSQ